METINIHEAKTQLSRLVEKAAKGEPFVIAKAGKPMVKVVPLDSPDAGQQKRLGFLAGCPDPANVCSDICTTWPQQTGIGDN